MALGMGLGMGLGIHYQIRHLGNGWSDKVQDVIRAPASQEPADESGVMKQI